MAQIEVELHKMFYTPLWRFKYPDFKNDEEYLVRYLGQDELYIVPRERNGLQTTKANLHKDPALERLSSFFHACAEYVMNDMGYKPDVGITSMWATRQRKGGFHHSHSHANSFLGAVFHLFDVNNIASGTVFQNLSREKYVIQPQRNGNELMLKPEEELQFESGTLCIFPAWATHYTRPTDCEYRIAVAANFMPIGMTDFDHYDRYNYPEIHDMVLKEYDDKK